MKRLLAATAVAVVMLAGTAQAQVIVRDGSDYNGLIPGGCTVFVHDDQPTELHVNCKRSDTKARIRYRFLRDRNATFDPAAVRVRYDEHGGDCSGTAVSWMVPIPRTVRVLVEPGCYLHILSVRWRQPVR